jgi:phospholipid/cholesterol/gamma-HCH transport system substrate-binding protein
LINKNLAVGVFVALALIAFVTATIWLTGNRASEPTVYYSMYFEKDVGGLMLGGPVFYLGVEVGTVTAMTIIPGNPMRVRVDAEVLQSAPIDSGTYASLALQGITGVAVIKLSADPGVHEPLELTQPEDGKGPGYLVIAVRDAGFSALLNKAPGIVEKLDDVLVQINRLLGEENREMVRAVLADLATVSGALAEQEESIGEIPVTLNNAMVELHASLIQIKSMAGDLEPELDSIMQNVNQATEDLAKMSARLDTWTANSDGEMNAFMQDGLGQVPVLVADARRTLREIEKLVKDLRENPSMLIYESKEDSVNVEQ